MWVVGDDFLNASVPQFMKWRNNQGKHAYINKCYEVTPFTVMETNNFLLQIKLGVHRAINANTYLPQILLVLLGDVIPSCEALFLKYEFYIQKVLQIVKEAVMRRRDQLPKKAKSLFDTKIIITKALPKPNDQEYKIRRRKYNRQLDVAAKLYNIESIHISDILPADNTMYEGPDLSDVGKKKLWMVLSDKIKNLDQSDVEALNKRRRERMTGDIDSNPNNWLYLNTRRRNVNRDSNQYLGIEVDFTNSQQPVNDIVRNRYQNSFMNHAHQMDRQQEIQRQIDNFRNSRGRQTARNEVQNWRQMMRFINRMDQNMNPDNRDNSQDARRLGRLFQAGDGGHIEMYRRRYQRNF